jgi:hypothetical protein
MVRAMTRRGAFIDALSSLARRTSSRSPSSKELRSHEDPHHCANVGKLTLAGKSKTHYKVTSSTNCGVHKGQSGDQIPCKSLGKSKYHGKQVRVTWKQVGGSKVASLVVVDL